MALNTAWWTWLLVFVLGAMVGSFLNVCIYRMPREESIVHPRSRCPGCKHPIVWYDNIPVLSYLRLRARCRHCRAPISWKYPVVEAMTGAATVAVYWQFGASPVSLIYLVFVWSLIVISFVDLEFQIIPDEISVGGLVVGLILSGLVPALHQADSSLMSLKRSLLGAGVGGGLLYATGLLGDVLFRKESMGGGDVKLLAMAGSILGWRLVALTFFIAPMIALVPGMFVLLFRKSHVIPYGPFLSIALVASLFAGDAILRMIGIEETIQLLWAYYRS